MSEVVCETCWEPLAEGAGACARCGTPRARPPRRPLVAPALARPLAVSAAVIILALSVVAMPVLRGGAPPAPPDPAAAGTPPAGPVAPPSGVFLVRTQEMPDSIGCAMDDRHADRNECGRWALRADGDAFTHVVSDGETLIAATLHAVLRVDAATGEVLWYVHHPQTSRPPVPASDVVVADDRVVVVREAEHRIVALDVRKGELAWEAPIEGERQAFIAVSKESQAGPPVVAIREADMLTVRRLDSGTVETQTPLRPGMPRPLIVGGRVLAASGPALTARDLVTGAHEWTAQVSLDPGSLVAAADESTVVVASPDGSVSGIDARTGELRWGTHWPGIRRLVPIGDGRVAAVADLSIQIFEDGHRPELAMPTVFPQSARSAGDGELLVSSGSEIHRLDPGLGGPTWRLQGVPTRNPAMTFVDGPAEPTVVAELGGAFLAAFQAPPPNLDDHGCTGARPSRMLGGQRGWRGDQFHMKANPFDGRLQQLMVGLPGATRDTTFTITGHPQGDPRTALAFARDPDEEVWTTPLTVADGGRTSSGWPLHWSVMTQADPGCWVFTIDGDPVVVPIPAPEEPTA